MNRVVYILKIIYNRCKTGQRIAELREEPLRTAPRREAVGKGDEEDGPGYVAGSDTDQVIEIIRQVHGVRMGCQHGQGHEGHVGDAMAEAEGIEDVQAPEDHDQFGTVRMAAEGTPHGQADEDVAEDAPAEDFQRRQRHLQSGGVRQSLGHGARIEACAIEEYSFSNKWLTSFVFLGKLQVEFEQP